MLHHMDLFHLVIAAFAGAVASGVNAIAGGGMLIAFPAAVAAGLPPLLANATSTVGLLPGSMSGIVSYRKHLSGSWRWTRSWALVSVIGGSVGALLLVRTP